MDYQKKRAFDFNLIIILSLSLFSLLFFIVVYKFLPFNFVRDSLTLRNSMISSTNFNFNDTFNNAAVFFKFLGFHYYTSDVFIQLFSWFVFLLFLLTTLRINKYKSFSTIQFMFVVFYIIVYGIYFTNFSKDLILIFLLLIVINLYLNNNRLIYIILFIGIYGMFFRGYWLILLILSFTFYFRKEPKLKSSMCIIIITSSLFLVFYDIFIDGNFLTNLKMINTTANSAMTNLFSNMSIFSDLINYYYSLISLLLPMQKLHVISVLLYYIWIIFNIFLFYVKRKQINTKMLLILFSFINVQALFEPDFGSAFRHQLALFPLLYLILYMPNSTKHS